MNCKDCQHRIRAHHYPAGREIHVCGIIDGDYLRDEYAHNNRKGAGIIAEADDDTGLSCELRVDDDFGCVKFERKEDV